MDLQMIGDLLRMVRRRLWVILVVVFAGLAGTVVYTATKASVYEATAKILVEAQVIPTGTTAGAGDQSTARRLQIIQERLMARDSLVAVVQKLRLYTDLPLTMNEKAELLRRSVRMDSISVQNQGWGGGNGDVVAFTITARFGDPIKVAAIVDEFVDNAIASNIRVREERARDTLEYYQSEDNRLALAITNLEGEIAAFKKANEDALPDSLTSRRNELSRLQESDLEVDRRIIDLEEEKGGIEMELAAPDAALPAAARTPEQTELRNLQLELAQRKSVLAPNHPELKRLRDRIAAVKALIPDEEADDAASAAADDRRVAMKRQVSLLSRQIEQLQAQKQTLAERRSALETSIQRTPEVESTLAGLNRRLVDLQDQHSSVAVRKAEARTGEQLEANRQSERFEVVESALVPEVPVEPNRMKLSVMGLGASLGLAGGLAFLLEMLNPVIRTSAQMQRQLEIRPVIAIPYVLTPGQRRARSVRRVAAVAVFLVVATAIGVPLYNRYGAGIAEKVGSTPVVPTAG